jgi:hypothetical protein
MIGASALAFKAGPFDWPFQCTLSFCKSLAEDSIERTNQTRKAKGMPELNIMERQILRKFFLSFPLRIRGAVRF